MYSVNRVVTLAFVLQIFIANTAAAFEFPHVVEQDKVKLELFPRSPDQIASFYEARGFPRSMIDILKQQCYITVRVHNKNKGLLWLELDNWSFTIDDKPVKREHRDVWKQRWQTMGIPLHNQSTFRWTLLPEVLDYLPDEQESGNLILPRASGKLSITARFATGDNKQGKPIVINYDELRCAN